MRARKGDIQLFHRPRARVMGLTRAEKQNVPFSSPASLSTPVPALLGGPRPPACRQAGPLPAPVARLLLRLPQARRAVASPLEAGLLFASQHSHAQP